MKNKGAILGNDKELIMRISSILIKRVPLLLVTVSTAVLFSCGGGDKNNGMEQTRAYHVFVENIFSPVYALPGDEITLNVTAFIEPGEYAMTIHDYSFTLTYDPSMITYVTAVPGYCLSAFGTIPTTFEAGLVNGTEGSVTVTESRSIEGPLYRGCWMAGLTFRVEANGRSDLVFPDVILKDAGGNTIPSSSSTQNLTIASAN